MKTFALPRLARSRVWWHSDPFDGSHRPESVALELWIPHGGYAGYALLGAALDRNGAGVRLECPEDGGIWPESLASVADEVHWGLAGEYRAPVKQAAASALISSGLQGGIAFGRAAYGAIGSSADLFSRVASALVNILVHQKEFFDEDRMRQKLEDLCAPR